MKELWKPEDQPSIVRNSRSRVFLAGQVSNPHHTTQALGVNLRPDSSPSDVRRSSEPRYHLQQTNSRTQRSDYNLANTRVSAIMKQPSSDFGDLQKTSSVCPFCNKTFKVLGKHLQYCKERKGRPYADVLAVSSGSQHTTIPPPWQVAVIKLLPKSTSASDPADPSLFQPLALTSCIGKLYTSILKSD